jgi:hypothetical protein
VECPQSIKLALERRDVIFQFLNVVHYGLPQFDDEIDWRSGAASLFHTYFSSESGDRHGCAALFQPKASARR